MKYFLLNQDNKAVNYINPKFDFLELKEIWKNSKPLFLNFQEKTNKKYLPFFNNQILIISQEMFDIIKSVQSDITCRPLILADTEKNIVKLYYFIEPKEVDCLSDNLSYKKDGSVEEIVLSKKR